MRFAVAALLTTGAWLLPGCPDDPLPTGASGGAGATSAPGGSAGTAGGGAIGGTGVGGGSGGAAAVACLPDGAAPDAPLPAQDTCGLDAGITLGAPIDDPEALTGPHHLRFDDAFCMQGTGAEANAGITVRIQPGATRLVVFMQGGGLCANDATCSGVRHPDGLPTDPQSLLGEWLLEGGPFFRETPLSDAHQVFVHYCSGDLHAGNRTTPVVAPGSATDGRLYTGRNNMKAFLSRLVPTFGAGGTHEVEEIFLAGSSAGGFGTLMSYDLVQRAFGCVPVHAFIDSAPPLGPGMVEGCHQAGWDAVLGLDPSLPVGCPDCAFADGNASAIIPYLASTYPGRRFGYFSATGDCTLRQLLGILGLGCGVPAGAGSAASFEAGLEAFRDGLGAHSNFRSFLHRGDWHTIPVPPSPLGDAVKGPDIVDDRTFADISVGTASGGTTTLRAWVDAFFAKDSPWSHVCGSGPSLDEHAGCSD